MGDSFEIVGRPFSGEEGGMVVCLIKLRSVFVDVARLRLEKRKITRETKKIKRYRRP